MNVALAISECQRVVTPDKIPCNIISTWSPGNCQNYNVLIMNESSSNIINYTWGNYTPVCNFSFNISSAGTFYYNSTIESGVITISPSDSMIYLLFIPLGLCFFFLYFAHTLKEEQEGFKWFFRMMSFLMLFPLFAGADIIIGKNPGYEGLRALFNMNILSWIFWLLFALGMIFFIVKIMNAFADAKKKDFEQGNLR